ncbi:MAG TPA: hypothetical protein VK494_05735, partial [Gemmatimonadaceae bacterium]|nr:hypothetical protein [Gemmatimonadaceae bacterium]
RRGLSCQQTPRDDSVDGRPNNGWADGDYADLGADPERVAAGPHTRVVATWEPRLGQGKVRLLNARSY